MFQNAWLQGIAMFANNHLFDCLEGILHWCIGQVAVTGILCGSATDLQHVCSIIQCITRLAQCWGRWGCTGVSCMPTVYIGCLMLSLDLA